MTNSKKEALRLLKTAKGQTEGIIRMIEEDRYCIDISKQILAVQALLKKGNLQILKGHIEGCVKTAMLENNEKDKIDEVMNILDKYMK